MTFNEFVSEINKLPEKFKNRDLETYLLAIYKNLEDNKKTYLKEEPSMSLILNILQKSFLSKPANFNKEWLAITQSPDRNRLSRKFTNKELITLVDKSNTSDIEGFDFTMSVLRFQIAELHKMRGKQLDNEQRYFGIYSETGCRWYNFDPFTNLECGTRCMIDNEDKPETIDWSFIGNLLEDGRVYE